MPNNFPMNRACPTQSPLATHRTLPLRIRLTASMPCKVRHALKLTIEDLEVKSSHKVVYWLGETGLTTFGLDPASPLVPSG